MDIQHKNHSGDIQEFVDPVCGMSTQDPSAFQRYDYKGNPYYFCSDTCLIKFKEDP